MFLPALLLALDLDLDLDPDLGLGLGLLLALALPTFRVLTPLSPVASRTRFILIPRFPSTTTTDDYTRL